MRGGATCTTEPTESDEFLVLSVIGSNYSEEWAVELVMGPGEGRKMMMTRLRNDGRGRNSNFCID
jgi:hypothetical protein